MTDYQREERTGMDGLVLAVCIAAFVLVKLIEWVMG